MKIIDQSATLEAITPNAAELIERAGRTCYKSEDKITPKSHIKFINMLIARGHLSVIEHASATVRLVTDRAVSLELVRHRLASYSQESTRFCNYGGKDLEFIRPVGMTPEAFPTWASAMDNAERAYKDLLWLGEPPEQARSVLPNSLKTEIVVTANFREWLHIFSLRLSPKAHPQMVDLMRKVRPLLANECPVVFGDPE